MMNRADLDVLHGDEYHAGRAEGDARSAAVVVPLLLELFPWVTSVVDAGCGTGAWLHEFQLQGVSRVLGLDCAGVSAHLLQIDPADVARVDFRQPFPPLGRFDLTISLEVADRLPGEVAQQFVADLTRLSDLIVFSAALPGQSAQPTVNERWASYWVASFAANRFSCFDILRERLWYDQRVSWQYAQNTLVFVNDVRGDLLDRVSAIPRAGVPDIVHPRALESFRDEAGRESAAQLRLYPYQLVEEGYRGYNILRIDVDRYLALAQSEGAYSPAKLAAGGYGQAYVAASAEEAKAKVPRRAFFVRLVQQGYKGYNILQIDVDKFIALPQSEGAYSPEKLAAGGYTSVCFAASVEGARKKVRSQTRRASG